MSEEAIGTTGQFPTLNSTEFATSYPASNSAPSQSATATSASGSSNASAGTATAQRAKQQPSGAEINSAIAAANANLASSGRSLDFRVDGMTGITVATIRNTQTGVVLQQIPGADILALARMLAAWSPGKHMLLDLIA